MIDTSSITPGPRMLTKDEEARRVRLRALRVARKFRSSRAAAKALGIPESSYRSNENGNRVLTEDMAMFYAEQWHARYEWLWDGVGEMQKSSGGRLTQDDLSSVSNASLQRIPAVASRIMLPVRGRAQGGADGVIVLDGTVMSTLPGPSSLDDVEGAYGVEVVGSSMEPRYEPGEIVWVHPTRTVHKGNYAVFQVSQPGGEVHAYVKRFERFSNGHVIAWQFNPPMEIEWPREDVDHMHLIVASGVR